MHRLVRSEHACEPPARGPCNGGRAEADGQGALAVHGRDLPLAAGEGRTLLARAPHDRVLLGRGKREAPDGAAG
eukprot:6254647-Alexandrium_andersonii.AAC.1